MKNSRVKLKDMFFLIKQGQGIMDRDLISISEVEEPMTLDKFEETYANTSTWDQEVCCFSSTPQAHGNDVVYLIILK